ncbi:hypothetical protein P153DRAFT_296360 [Dothidotthia symphoricarpi CBS 119687]|uniref:Uncharacterized protein n=1 Tax=Dothidotthia symphoricarpi CBS 119687 TaxID=1392245 RepID=A0A6A6A6Y2_9PLEO|nr:uncharacterized protein P153DRAFT_296360 [Dothidotthia symphoricarpi CBS 119687]KAF2126834.1 hypothetical protein P153DRAFT_296360 [Dothidotthia symphoricarpi CBS 119687]
MSRPSVPYGGTTGSSYMSSTEQDNFSQAQLDQLFAAVENGYSSNDTGVLNDLDYRFDSSLVADSSNPSTISTPNYSNYSFTEANTYPTPGPSTPHPYPFELQQQFQPNTTASAPTYGHNHPLPVFSHTNNRFFRSTQPPQPYVRRRSLSQGDAERIATTNTVPANPTFFRLQAPRARSAAAEDDNYRKRRGAPYPKHGRSASQGPGARGRQSRGETPTSMPWGMQGGMLPTPIGTPLSAMDMDSPNARPTYHGGMPMNPTGMPMQYEYSNDLMLRHMTGLDQLAKSRQIIEIGAMAVYDKVRLDPRLDQETGKSIHERILEKLEDVERYLKEGGVDCEQVLRSCTTIREALARKIEDEDALNRDKEISSVEEDADSLNAPSKVYGDGGLCDGGIEDNEDGDLMTMLMKENERFEAGKEDV